MKEILGPYLMKSGKHAGEYLEELIFSDPDYVDVLSRYRKPIPGSNHLHEHLGALLESTPETIVLCPICRQRRVKYFLFLNSETVMDSLICCNNPDCQQTLKANHHNDYLLPLKLKAILSLKGKTLRKKTLRLLKGLVGLPPNPKAKDVFKIFIGEQLPVDNKCVFQKNKRPLVDAYQLSLDFK